MKLNVAPGDTETSTENEHVPGLIAISACWSAWCS